MTWPLPRLVGTHLAQDLIDPLLNCWALGWGSDHILRAISGNPSALAGFWDANIFHPEPLALAFSEHLVAQVVQILPVYAVSGNLVLSYNLLFLSTFVLSALGAYLLVRELTGSGLAAVAAGLLYGFAPFRAFHFGHLQVLSSQWMPFALFFLRRYFERQRTGWLSAAVVALVLQNLSCGYYLLFFSPFVAAYVLYEMTDRGLVRNRRVWGHVVGAGLVTLIATMPFLLPYLQLRASGVPPRPPSEVDYFSADVFSYLTTDPDLRLWGRLMQVFPKPEGTLFPGLVPVVLAAIGLLAHARRVRGLAAGHPLATGPRRWPARSAAVVLAASSLLAVLVLLGGRAIPLLRRISPYAANLSYVVPVALAAFILLIVLSPRARVFVRGVPGSTRLFYVAALVAAAWLSFGRVIESMGYRVSHETLYGWLYRFVPGFDGLRVPSRYAMLVALFLAVLAGFGAAGLERASRRGRLIVLGCCVLFLVEVASIPIEVKALSWPPGTIGAAAPMAEPFDAARIYRFIATLPSEAVLTEFPFGDEQDEVRYMYFSTRHWRRLTNGYSGTFPQSYLQRRQWLSQPWANSDEAWAALEASGTTHVIVHEWAYEGRRGAAVSAWLRERGARVVAAYQTDVLYSLR